MVFDARKFQIERWFTLEDENILRKTSYSYDSSMRIIEEYKTRVNIKPGGPSLYRSFTYDVDGKAIGGTPEIREWTTIQENNQSSSDVLQFNSMMKDGGDFVMGVDYDLISYTYPTLSSEVITYTLGGSTVRTVTITYLTDKKRDISTVVIV